MEIKLVGGPLDGASFKGPESMPVYIVVKNHPEEPIYKAMLSAHGTKAVYYYYFLGYEKWLAEPA